jgi:hypothetical protein
MDDLLRQVRRKFSRADEHIDALHEGVQGWCAANTNSGVTEDDPVTGDRVLRLKLKARPPVLDWGVLIGDALHNMRSGLDQLAWVLGGNPPRNPKTSEFPIYIDAEKFKAKGLKAIRGVPAPARKVMVGVQPCERRKTAKSRERDPLWVLHELSNEDKHRLLHLGAIIAANRASISLDLGEPFVGPLRDDHILRRWVASDPKKPKCATHHRLALVIAFDQKGPGARRPVVDCLRQISAYVGTSVFDPLERFL